MVDTVTLKDGTPGWAWPLLPTHRDSLARAFDELSPESRRLRFLTPVEHLSEAMLHQLVDEVDGVDHIALVLFAETPTQVLPIAIGRIVRYPEMNDVADLAVTVRDDWQGRGAATALLHLLARHRPAGVHRILTEVAMENPASLAMLRHLGPLRVTDTGAGVFDVEIDLDSEPDVPTQVPEPTSATNRVHPALDSPNRTYLRNRDRLCGWLNESHPETTGIDQSTS
ncbi:MAG TPA: GNAT family N-acetyltransferase [Marmoricola sp.]|nr:GNAT family N-acetyltransferase [Marmoricola sp.]HNN47744.1 GNAT family N-acetyltransferase [Marmoricola sp.]HNO40839.1 GNAT family N-acetyltransferase [Marmoricola sp.]